MPQQRHAAVFRGPRRDVLVVQEEYPILAHPQQAPQPRVPAQLGRQRRHAAHPHAARLPARLLRDQCGLLRHDHRLLRVAQRRFQAHPEPDRIPFRDQHDPALPHVWPEQPAHQPPRHVLRHVQPPPSLDGPHRDPGGPCPHSGLPRQQRLEKRLGWRFQHHLQRPLHDVGIHCMSSLVPTPLDSS
jgi:hypothetical protein